MAEDIQISNRTDVNRQVEADDLAWLADAPLFIDEDLVGRFYDAVVMPDAEQGETRLSFSAASDKETGVEGAAKGAVELSASAKPSSALAKLAQIFPFIDIEVAGKVAGEATAAGHRVWRESQGEDFEVVLHPIQTPQRRLVQLCLHYYANHPDRFLYVSNPADPSWHKPEHVLATPRLMAFLDFPGQREAEKSGQSAVKVIPTAAEFGDGKVIPLTLELTRSNGQRPPSYPELGKKGEGDSQIETVEQLEEARRKYWTWFAEEYSAMKAVDALEKAAFEHGRIRWVDYRVLLDSEGHSVHLHVSPAQGFDTGTFAYNLIKRSEKHGLRIVGLLKSEPDLNVLAVYEK